MQAKDTIAVISDLHLNYNKASIDFQRLEDVALNDTSLKNTLNAIKDIKQRKSIKHIIVNGDIFDGRSLSGLSWDEKIELIENFLKFIRKAFPKIDIYFNTGNHDEVLETDSKPSSEFSLKLEASISKLEHLGIYFIGRHSREVYSYKIEDFVFEISHSPFIKTEAILRQLERIPSINGAYHRAVLKVRNQKMISADQIKDGVIRVYSDNHAPLIDVKTRVYDSGKLTYDPTLPHEPFTYLILNEEGVGSIVSINKEGKASVLDPNFKYPNCSSVL